MVTDELANKLAAAGPLEGVGSETVRAVAEHTRERRLRPGETLLRQGEAGGGVYVVVEGRLRTVLDDHTDTPDAVALLDAGAVLGEIACMTGGRREATVVADTSATVIEIAASGMELLLEREPEVAGRLAELATVRLRQAQLARQVATLFPEVDAPVRDALLAGVQWVHLRVGDSLVKRGDPADAAYVVVSGRLRATAGELAGDVLADIGPGELVGEMALVEDGMRTATLVAARESHLARLARDDFLAALRGHPESLLGIARNALRRASGISGVCGEARRTVLLVAAQPSVDLSRFACALVPALERLGSTRLLRQRDVEHALGARSLAQGGPDGPGAARVTQWLQQQEERHETLLLQSDSDWSPWNDLALRHADQVVVVSDAAVDPALTHLEQRLHEALRQVVSGGLAHVSTSLVLLHPGVDGGAIETPRGTSRWLALRDVDACYHVRRGHRRDFARLARIMAGCAVGLVLSGGGARGYAHLGVMRALEEAGVPVDIVAGTSIGAVMAAFAAFDVGCEEQERRAKSTLRQTLDWTLPLAGLVKGGQMAALADRETGGRDIEDLWLPWFAVSTNLTRSQVAVHRRGSITRALRASVAIPGIVPPVVYGDELHVDGGVLDNLPVEPMRRINPRGLVIAVDVALNAGPRARGDFGLSVSGWRLLADRMMPGRAATPVPAITATLTQSMIAGSSRARDRVIADGLADLYLPLHLPRCGMLEFGTPDQIIAAGYDSAAARVREWAEALPAPVRARF
ncbi:MAG: cyclic nucleotide-binding domain-containing protein [Ectothiorhodospiraceae bacterium]|nr:cyclic nucleotide-binding domain-containing protein [Ectothiorhodospiraceae bacterium]MCH8502935.1 cyclic nucleotide-binding domain-containing protein [Ectothiorhodospiraceae bacterium]